MTLTEQWKKGELEIDHNYYLRLKNGRTEIQLFVGAFLMEEGNEVEEVLAEVPTYKEYQQLLSDQLAKQEGEEIIAELEHENLLLKVANFELRNRLSTIRAFINHGIDDDDTSFFDLLKKIEKVLPND